MQLQLKNSQGLMLSEKNLQALRILQLSNVELVDFIQSETQSNPLLEATDLEAPENTEEELSLMRVRQNALDLQNKAYYKADYTGDLYERVTRGTSLYEFLMEQLITGKKNTNYKICEYIIHNLDSRGYFDDNIAETAKRLNVSQKAVSDSLKIVQALEPPGIGARDLVECLKLQLKSTCDELTVKIIENDLVELSKIRFSALARKYCVSEERIVKCYEVIKSLTPKPAASFGGAEGFTEYSSPDVIVLNNNNKLEVLLYDNAIPSININQNYIDMLDTQLDEKTRQYIRKKSEQAAWLISCIEKRKTTLLNSVKFIAEKQKRFFIKGEGHLAPLKIADVAQELSFHESTVCRAIKNKYLQCRFGTFPLSYFFINELKSTADSSVSPDGVKMEIKRIIEAEGIRALSDSDISKLLSAKGMSVKRRTVAKYRNEIGYPTAAQRACLRRMRQD